MYFMVDEPSRLLLGWDFSGTRWWFQAGRGEGRREVEVWEGGKRGGLRAGGSQAGEAGRGL